MGTDFLPNLSLPGSLRANILTGLWLHSQGAQPRQRKLSLRTCAFPISDNVSGMISKHVPPFTPAPALCLKLRLSTAPPAIDVMSLLSAALGKKRNPFPLVFASPRDENREFEHLFVLVCSLRCPAYVLFLNLSSSPVSKRPLDNRNLFFTCQLLRTFSQNAP